MSRDMVRKGRGGGEGGGSRKGWGGEGREGEGEERRKGGGEGRGGTVNAPNGF